MTKTLLIHGWGGSDFPHWQSWLASELAKDYGTVSFLRFQNFDNPNLNAWKDQLTKALNDFKPDIIVAHSLGTTLWFHLCNEGIEFNAKKLYLVAPPSLFCNTPELQEFFPIQAPQQLFANQSKLICSTNDPYMTEQEAYELKEKLNIEMIMLQNAGHINTQSGYGEWPWILEDIKSS